MLLQNLQKKYFLLININFKLTGPLILFLTEQLLVTVLLALSFFPELSLYQSTTILLEVMPVDRR